MPRLWGRQKVGVNSKQVWVPEPSRGLTPTFEPPKVGVKSKLVLGTHTKDEIDTDFWAAQKRQIEVGCDQHVAKFDPRFWTARGRGQILVSCDQHLAKFDHDFGPPKIRRNAVASCIDQKRTRLSYFHYAIYIDIHMYLGSCPTNAHHVCHYNATPKAHEVSRGSPLSPWHSYVHISSHAIIGSMCAWGPQLALCEPPGLLGRIRELNHVPKKKGESFLFVAS